jgi:hypothetical protein
MSFCCDAKIKTQNFSNCPREKVAAKKLAKGFTYKASQPIPESPFIFLKADEIPSTLEVAKLAVSLALAEKGKPSPDRALAFLEETEEMIYMSKQHIRGYEKSKELPIHYKFKDGIRFILRIEGQSRPKRELEQFTKFLRSHLAHEIGWEAFDLWINENPDAPVCDYKENFSGIAKLAEKLSSERIEEYMNCGFDRNKAVELRRSKANF